MKRRIDWIFYTPYFKSDLNCFETIDPPFNTDHKIVKQTLQVNHNLQVDQSKPERQFQIPETYFKDQKFVNEVKENFQKTRNKPLTSVGKLQELIDAATQTAKRYKKRKDLEKKKKKAQLRKDLKKNKEKRNSSDNSSTIKAERKKLLEQIDNVLYKDLVQENWKKKIDLEKIKGPNKVSTKYLKMKNQVKNNLKHLTNEKGEEFVGTDAANLAREVYEKVYKDDELTWKVLKDRKMEKSSTKKPIEF